MLFSWFVAACYGCCGGVWMLVLCYFNSIVGLVNSVVVLFLLLVFIVVLPV